MKNEALAEQFVFAIGQKNIKNYTKAETALEKCLKINKNHSATLYHLADINLINLKPNKALNYIDRAIANDKKNNWYRELNAKIYRSQNDYKNEVKVYEYLHAENPDKRVYLKMLIVAYQKKGDMEHAVLLLNKKMNTYGIKSKDVRYKEWMLNRQGKKLEIIVDYIKLQKKYPENIDIVKKLVELYTEKKDVENAEKWRKKLNKSSADGSYEEKLEDLKKRGKTLDYIKIYTQAIKNKKVSINTKINIVKKALDRRDVSELVRRKLIALADTLARTFYQVSELNEVVADNLLIIGEYDRALSLYDNATKGNTTKFIILQKSYNLATDLQDFKAIHSLTNYGLRMFPSVVKLYVWKAKAYLQENNIEDAKEYIESGLAYSLNDNDEHVFNLLKVQADKSSLKSEFDIEKINNEKVLIAYVEYLRAMNINDKPALKYIEKANALSTEGKYDILKAKVLFERGKTNDAKKLCSQILAKKSYNLPMIELMGDILNKEGNTSEANKYWEKALSLGSKSTAIKQKLK